MTCICIVMACMTCANTALRTQLCLHRPARPLLAPPARRGHFCLMWRGKTETEAAYCCHMYIVKCNQASHIVVHVRIHYLVLPCHMCCAEHLSCAHVLRGAFVMCT